MAGAAQRCKRLLRQTLRSRVASRRSVLPRRRRMHRRGRRPASRGGLPISPFSPTCIAPSCRPPAPVSFHRARTRRSTCPGMSACSGNSPASLRLCRRRSRWRRTASSSNLPTFIYMDDYLSFEGTANLDQVALRLDRPTPQDETLLMIFSSRASTSRSSSNKATSQDPATIRERQYDLQDAAELLTRAGRRALGAGSLQRSSFARTASASSPK